MAVVLALVAAGAAVLVAGPGEPPTVGLLVIDYDVAIMDLYRDGFARAARDFGFEPVVIAGSFGSLEDELGSLAASGTGLVLTTDLVFYPEVAAAAARYPGTVWAYVDPAIAATPSIGFAEHEGSYLIGAAAALTSETGTIGFLGGWQFATIERFRAGFEAGARAVDPAIEILATYTAVDGSGFSRDDLARVAATDMYERGADVVFHAAGAAGAGVFTAAREASANQGRHVWAIGVDADQYLDVPVLERPYVLTSMIKRVDVAVYELIRDFLDGGLEPTAQVLGLEEGGVGYSTSGGHLAQDTIAVLEGLREAIVSGALAVPRSPSGDLEPPRPHTVTDTVTVTYDGTTCRADSPRFVHARGPGPHRVRQHHQPRRRPPSRAVRCLGHGDPRRAWRQERRVCLVGLHGNPCVVLHRRAVERRHRK